MCSSLTSRSFTLLAVLLVYQTIPTIAKAEEIVVINKTGDTLKYKYRPLYNDGKGSADRISAVTHKEGAQLTLKGASPDLDYGIRIQFPEDGRYSRKLNARFGPYEIREGERFDFETQKKVKTVEIYDKDGKEVEEKNFF